MSLPNYPKFYWQNAGTASNTLKITGQQLIGFIIPAIFASTTISFKMSVSNNTPLWVPVKNSSGLISFTVSANTADYYGFTQDQKAAFEGCDLLQILSGSSEVVNTAVQAVTIPRVSIT